jgi:hypothetical protein
METTTVEDKLFQFIKDCWQNQCSLEIILFLGKHPCTRFNCRAITQTAIAQGLDIQRALSNLISRGLVTNYSDNGNALYSLTKEEPLRSLVLSMVDLNRHQLQVTLTQISKQNEPLTRAVPLVAGNA